MGAVEDVPDGLAVFLLQNPLHPVHLLLHLQTQQVLNIWLAANMDAIAGATTPPQTFRALPDGLGQ